MMFHTTTASRFSAMVYLQRGSDFVIFETIFFVDLVVVLEVSQGPCLYKSIMITITISNKITSSKSTLDADSLAQLISATTLS